MSGQEALGEGAGVGGRETCRSPVAWLPFVWEERQVCLLLCKEEKKESMSVNSNKFVGVLAES